MSHCTVLIPCPLTLLGDYLSGYKQPCAGFKSFRKNELNRTKSLSIFDSHCLAFSEKTSNSFIPKGFFTIIVFPKRPDLLPTAFISQWKKILAAVLNQEPLSLLCKENDTLKFVLTKLPKISNVYRS